MPETRPDWLADYDYDLPPDRIALAARHRGIACHVVMPTNAPSVKRVAVADFGARIYDCEPTLADRESTLAEVVASLAYRFGDAEWQLYVGPVPVNSGAVVTVKAVRYGFKESDEVSATAP